MMRGRARGLTRLRSQIIKDEVLGEEAVIAVTQKTQLITSSKKNGRCVASTRAARPMSLPEGAARKRTPSRGAWFVNDLQFRNQVISI
jgi:hypothetical protein